MQCNAVFERLVWYDMYGTPIHVARFLLVLARLFISSFMIDGWEKNMIRIRSCCFSPASGCGTYTEPQAPLAKLAR